MISVIVPIYNAEKFIKESVDSIINQTFRDLEIILVDDGSTDNSYHICKEYEKADNRVKVVHQDNGGILSARQAGLAASTGELVSFIDSDDWIDSCFYEKLYELQVKNNADVVVSGCRKEHVDRTEDIFNNFPEGLYEGEDLIKKIYPQMMYFKNNSLFAWGITQYFWNKLYKREIIAPCVEEADTEIVDGEDVSCVFYSFLRASSIYVDNHPYYHYRIHDASICTKPRGEKYFANAVKLGRHLRKVFSGIENGDLALKQVPYFLNMLLDNGTNEVFRYGQGLKYSTEDWKLPQAIVDKPCKVSIYGAGRLGKSYYSQLMKKKDMEIVSWVDSKSFGKKVGMVVIQSPQEALKGQEDYILVAALNRETAMEIKNDLIKQGVLEDKIIWEEPERIYLGLELVVHQ